MDRFTQNIAYAFRALKNRPGFAATVVGTLALAIGVNTAVFSVMYAVMLKPMSYPAAERLVLINEQVRDAQRVSVSYPNYLDWAGAQRSFTELSLFRWHAFNLSSDRQSHPERVQGLQATANLLSILGVRPQIGRDLKTSDDEIGSPSVILIGDRLWRARFGGSQSVLGARLLVDGVDYEIVGVLPPEMDLGQKPQVLMPLGRLRGDPEILRRGNRPGFSMIGRLRPGMTLEQARAEFGIIGRELEKHSANMGRRPYLRTLREENVGDYRKSLYVLVGAAACVLLIACGNIAGLFLARGASRTHELGVRAALGGSRSAIAAQLATESALLVFLGAIAGLLVAVGGLHLIVALSPTGTLQTDYPEINASSLWFTVGIASLVALLGGAGPAWQIATGANPLLALREGGRGGSARGASRAHAGLVVLQVALALALLTAAGLLLNSFWRMQRIQLGFSPKGTLVLATSLPPRKYKTEGEVREFYRLALERLGSLPGVASVASAANIPFDGMTWDGNFRITGTAKVPGNEPRAEISVVSHGYFRTLSISLLRGRTFDDNDRPGDNWAVIIDETFAERYFPGTDPIGKHIDNYQKPEKRLPPATIIGVVRGTVNDDPSGPFEKMNLPQLYFSADQHPQPAQMFLIHTTSKNPTALADPVRAQILAVDHDQPVWDVAAMESLVSRRVADRKLTMVLTMVFAALALTLAVVGLFGVISLRVAQRTTEIGVRLAVGASRTQIFALIIGDAAKLTGLGFALGAIASWLLTRLLSGLVFGIGTGDPATLFAVLFLFALSAFLASYLPARRAAQLDPLEALREQ
jgi:putative ABC transport system permease protein